jgi:hypothetical protein
LIPAKAVQGRAQESYLVDVIAAADGSIWLV